MKTFFILHRFVVVVAGAAAAKLSRPKAAKRGRLRYTTVLSKRKESETTQRFRMNLSSNKKLKKYLQFYTKSKEKAESEKNVFNLESLLEIFHYQQNIRACSQRRMGQSGLKSTGLKNL